MCFKIMSYTYHNVFQLSIYMTLDMIPLSYRYGYISNSAKGVCQLAFTWSSYQSFQSY